jgi:hypothetical protein
VKFKRKTRLDSARIPQLPEARWNPGAAKASDCEVSKSFALSHVVAMRLDIPSNHRCPMSAQRQKPIDFAVEGLHLAFLSIATEESGFI